MPGCSSTSSASELARDLVIHHLNAIGGVVAMGVDGFVGINNNWLEGARLIMGMIIAFMMFFMFVFGLKVGRGGPTHKTNYRQ